ncbi:hypothetical protein TEA_011899 [Camellia sinensis var. sinensis]|uniref:Enoyl reductase (ER) domain-containing protein n=1 Tax=Camellia sinensis var. sinensis TaxID=542762 RepID=A0A4S4EME8_CAMSN|nr:hypothetical protein TEA_011899 [Camellia sinensis var. sinensis]
MEALICEKLGDPTLPPSSTQDSPLTLSTSHPIPKLNSPTSVRVRVKATSLNFANYLQILGKYQEKPPLPFIPGSDYSGVVESIGPNVSKFRIGDPVCSLAALGSFAQFIVADETDLYRVPDGCDLVAAGALPVAYGTSHVALVHRAQLSTGQVLLVLGAAGGVGISAVQIGKICGAVVIAVARGGEKVQFLKSMGVDHVVDSNKGNVTESVKGFLKSRKLKGVDVLYDPVGGKLAKETMKLLNWGAQILVIGFASGDIPVIPANIALVKANLAFSALKDRKVIGKRSSTSFFTITTSEGDEFLTKKMVDLLYFYFENPILSTAVSFSLTQISHSLFALSLSFKSLSILLRFFFSSVIHLGIAILKFDFEHRSVIHLCGFGALSLLRSEVIRNHPSALEIYEKKLLESGEIRFIRVESDWKMMLYSLFTSCLSNELQKVEPVEKKLMDNIRQYQVPLQKYMAMMDLEVPL